MSFYQTFNTCSNRGQRNCIPLRGNTSSDNDNTTSLTTTSAAGFLDSEKKHMFPSYSYANNKFGCNFENFRHVENSKLGYQQVVVEAQGAISDDAHCSGTFSETGTMTSERLVHKQSVTGCYDTVMASSYTATRTSRGSGCGGGGGNRTRGRQPKRTNGVKASCRHVPHHQKAPHLVARRNARERRRVQAVNLAFGRLRKHIPYENKHKRLSKVKTLRCAIDYIRRMQSVIEEYDKSVSSRSREIGKPMCVQTTESPQLGRLPWRNCSQARRIKTNPGSKHIGMGANNSRSSMNTPLSHQQWNILPTGINTSIPYIT